MPVEIKLGKLKQELNRTSAAGTGNLQASISQLERVATYHDPAIDISLGYSFLSLRWEIGRRKASASISRSAGEDAVLLTVRDEVRDTDCDWSETYAKLQLEIKEAEGYALGDTVSYWRPNHVSNFPRRGDHVAEFTLGKVLRITPESIVVSRIVPTHTETTLAV